MPNHIRKALLRGQAYRSPHDLRRVMIKLDRIAREMDQGIEAMSASVDRFLQIRQPALRYAIYDGYVVSRTDGQLHYVPAPRLIDLYGLRPTECRIVRDGMPVPKGLIPLRPRDDGRYAEHLAEVDPERAGGPFQFVPLDVKDATITIGDGPREAFNGTIEVRVPAGAPVATWISPADGPEVRRPVWIGQPTPASLLELLEKEPHSWGGDPE